jgi:hypothetical protein
MEDGSWARMEFGSATFFIHRTSSTAPSQRHMPPPTTQKISHPGPQFYPNPRQARRRSPSLTTAMMKPTPRPSTRWPGNTAACQSIPKAPSSGRARHARLAQVRHRPMQSSRRGCPAMAIAPTCRNPNSPLVIKWGSLVVEPPLHPRRGGSLC